MLGFNYYNLADLRCQFFILKILYVLQCIYPLEDLKTKWGESILKVVKDNLAPGHGMKQY